MKWVKRWQVESMTSNNIYTVALDENGDYGCSCPVWKFKRRECKHIARIKDEQRNLQVTKTKTTTRYNVIELPQE